MEAVAAVSVLEGMIYMHSATGIFYAYMALIQNGACNACAIIV